MPRFAILRHETPPGSPRPLHWDFLLEDAGTLLTWALAESPTAGHPIAADALANHRTAYLDYEGPVSGNRGAVTRWDAGTFQWRHRSDREIAVLLKGGVLKGEAILTRWTIPRRVGILSYGPKRRPRRAVQTSQMRTACSRLASASGRLGMNSWPT
jgi:hypothetical protein